MNLDPVAIRRFMAKREDGAEYVYRKTYRLVYSLCFDLLRHPQDAEDAAMTAYANVLSSGKAFVSGAAFLSYLCLSAKHAAINLAKSRAKVDQLEEEGVTEETTTEDDALLNAMKQVLDEEDYDLVVSHLCLGLPFPVIASLQGGSASSCRGRYFRAMKKLRASLREEDFR